MGEENRRRYHRIINEVWKFIKEHDTDILDDDFWIKFIDDMREEVNKAEASDKELLRKMLVAYENDLAGGTDG